MACCAPSVFPFNNAASSTIEYGPALQALHGGTPKVFVLYREEDGTYLVAPWFTRIEFSAGQIRVDHGGPQIGLVIVG
jgi:hypothetical protein